MSYRSWLRDAKTVHDLGNHCHTLSGEEPDSLVREIRHIEKWRQRQLRPIPVADEYRKFFGFLLHDAEVIETKRTGSTFTLSMDCLVAKDFIHGLSAILEIPAPEATTKVDLVAHNTEYVRWARHGKDGNLRFGTQAQTTKFSHNWFETEDDRIQWIVQFYSFGDVPQKLDISLFLMVDCERLSAVDYRLPTLTRLFGEAAAPLWIDVVNSDDLNIWNYEGMEEFLRKRMSELNLSVTDFSPTFT